MTAFFNDSDIPAMFAGIGAVNVSLDGVSGQGLVDYADAIMLQNFRISGVINKAITVMLQTSQFPSLTSSSGVGKSITVDGTAYTVRERLQTTDGAITHILCTN